MSRDEIEKEDLEKYNYIISEDEDIELILTNDDDDDDDDDIEDMDEDMEDVVDVDEDTKSAVLSKHKIEGKHSLKYDSIFKGKKEEPLKEEDMLDSSTYTKDTIEVDKTSSYHHESINNEVYIRSKLVKEKVYGVLKEHTSINFMNNRRKPSRLDFNNYYDLLKTHLLAESFTNIELFNELSVYFSDNLFNMFKLLDNKWRNIIISELQDHIGENKTSKEIQNRNIYEGTELEFIQLHDDGEKKVITGVVLETFYKTSTFKVDSYENIYVIKLEDITKILNNTKFKYNLNKLNNIDFL